MDVNKLDRYWWWILAASIILPVLLIFLVMTPDIPLGEPGIWVWQRLTPFFWDIAGWGAAAVLFAVSAAAAWKLDNRGGGTPLPGLLLAAVILLGGIGADWMVLSSGRAGLSENTLAVLNPFTTGYLQPARTAKSVTGDFVRDVLTVPAGEVPHHRHVHPPGNIYLAELAKILPGTWGQLLLPGAYRDLLTLKEANGLIPPLDTTAMIEAALKLVVIFWLALELGKLLLAWILWRCIGLRGRGLGLLAIAFGGNGALLFLGHYDTFYFLIASAVLLSLFYAMRKPCLGAVAGVLTGIGGLLTLGFGAIGGVAAGVLLTGTGKQRRWKAFGFFAGAGLLMAGLLHGCGIYVIDIALKCWENQQLFQQMSGRGYGVWAMLNVADALLFCGVLPSLAILLPPTGRGRMFHMWACAFFFWFFILFSGGARGEFGRLAVVYLPVLLLMLSIRLGQGGDRFRWGWRVLAIGVMFAQTALLRNALKLVLID